MYGKEFTPSNVLVVYGEKGVTLVLDFVYTSREVAKAQCEAVTRVVWDEVLRTGAEVKFMTEEDLDV